ncbi:MAG: hypothetical protein RLZZ324_914 [Candidatus Parcubacteria bacterium]|jgi:glutamate racemase
MIGIFDSGLGGLTVVKELMKRLPRHDFAYFGDTARTPYGTKGPAVIKRFGVEDARFLVSKGAKIIIVACNTVSAVAIAEIRAAVKVPLFEVVVPAVLKAAAITDGRVGIIGTRGTIGSGIYARLLEDAAPTVKSFGQACPLFVPLVEEDWATKPEARTIAAAYLKPLRARKIDTLILGCTHYPFLKPAIRAALPKGVRIVDPAHEVVEQLAHFLSTHAAVDATLGKRGVRRFYVSDVTAHAAAVASRWLGKPVVLEHATIS